MQICILQTIKEWRWEWPGNEANQGLHRDVHYRDSESETQSNERLQTSARLDAAVLTLADLSFFQQWDGDGAELAHCGHLELLRHKPMSLVDLWQMVVVCMRLKLAITHQLDYSVEWFPLLGARPLEKSEGGLGK